MAFDRLVIASRSILLAGLFATSLLASPGAFAQPSSADKETARNLMKEGDAKFASKDYAGALKAYEAAHAIMQVPSTGLPLAKAQLERGLLVEARDTLLQVTRHPKEASEPAAYAKAREEATELSQKIAPRIPSVTIAVEGAPSGDAVEVRVDGAVVPPAALSAPRKVNPGSHTITASASGFKTATANVSLKEGETEKVTLKLVPGAGAAPAAAPKGSGKLKIESPTEAGNVFVDGKAVGATPLEIPVEAGSHEIEIEFPGGTQLKKRVTVAAGATTLEVFAPSPMDAVARHRKGVSIGVAGGPWMAARLDGGSPLFGGTAHFVFNIGITPAFDFRTGAAATVLQRFNDGNEATQLSVVIPASLRINVSPWFSLAAGLSAGFAADLEPDDDAEYGFSIGPEWSVLTMCAGEKRQYELAFTQGLRFGDVRQEYHQALVFTYLLLDRQ
jgi:hypothetical protein